MFLAVLLWHLCDLCFFSYSFQDHVEGKTGEECCGNARRQVCDIAANFDRMNIGFLKGEKIKFSLHFVICLSHYFHFQAPDPFICEEILSANYSNGVDTESYIVILLCYLDFNILHFSRTTMLYPYLDETRDIRRNIDPREYTA